MLLQERQSIRDGLDQTLKNVVTLHPDVIKF